MTSPLVSVVLPAHNGAAELPQAVASILRQSFADFELIAINDGSTDATAAILDGIHDPRLRVVHQDNAGLAGTLNRGIALARGRYIARQDQDDVAMPTRLARQVAFMEANPDHALLGTRAEIRSGDRPARRFHDHPADDAALRFELLFDNPFVHSSVMLRKSALEEVGGYATDPARQPPEDYELWSRLARRWHLANLPERLTIYCETPGSMSRVAQNPFQEKLVLISSENLAAAAGDTAPSALHRDVAALMHSAFGLVSRDPDFEAMRTLIEQAGARIDASAPGSDVPARVARRINKLRRRSLQKRYWAVLGPAWPLLRLGWHGARRLRHR